MSQTADGLYLVCNGVGCQARAQPPVALRSVLAGRPGGNYCSSNQWLYVRHQGRWLHYCPTCAQKHLMNSAALGEHEAQTAPAAEDKVGDHPTC